MATSHSGNIQNEVTLEEHDGTQNARRVSVISSATIYASVAFAGNVTLNPSPNFIGLVTIGNTPTVTPSGNVTLNPSTNFIGLITAVQGSTAWQGMATLYPGPNFIGLVTIGNTPSVTPVGNVTLNTSPNYIGLVTNYPVGVVTLAPSPNFIGLVSLAQPISTTFSGNITLDAGSRTGIAGNITLSNSQGFIGLVTVGNTVSTTFSGNVTLDAGSFTGIRGNLTLANANGFIGLVTLGGGTAWANPNAYIGLVTVGNTVSTTFSGNITLDAGSRTAIAGNVTLSNSQGFIGLVTVGNTPAVSQSGTWTVQPGNTQNTTPWLTQQVGNITIQQVTNAISLVSGYPMTGIVTIANPANVGNVTLNAGPNFIGLTTVWHGSNVTLNASAAYIGLATVIPAYISPYTSVATVLGASGSASVIMVTPPASNYFYIKDLTVTSLGRSEVQFLSSATTLIPWMGLATTGGAVMNFGDTGLKGRAADHTFVVGTNGQATISVMVNVRFAAS